MTTDITQAIQSKYGQVAQSSLTNDHQGVQAIATAFGYTAQELASIPAQANMGLSCGNPTALASLKPGETVVDLGSGGGLDVFLASAKVGPTGKAIGIDMTPAMIERARRAAEQGVNGQAMANVEFHLAPIDRLPLPDASVDCVISNCVINLAPDKSAVFAEIARVLKPGGRLAVSDIALKKPLPSELAGDVMAYVGCIAGAIPIDEYRQKLLAAGFEPVQVIDSGCDLNAYAKLENQAGCCPPPSSPLPSSLPASSCSSSPETSPARGCCGGSKKSDADSSHIHQRLVELLKRYDVNDYAASVKVLAVKPLA